MVPEDITLEGGSDPLNDRELEGAAGGVACAHARLDVPEWDSPAREQGERKEPIVDTAGVVPMAHAQDVCLPLRPDAVTASDHHALYQSVAPAVEDGLYLVPKVIE